MSSQGDKLRQEAHSRDTGVMHNAVTSSSQDVPTEQQTVSTIEADDSNNDPDSIYVNRDESNSQQQGTEDSGQRADKEKETASLNNVQTDDSGLLKNPTYVSGAVPQNNIKAAMSDSCRPGYKLLTSTCVRLSSRKMTYWNAKSVCKKEGATLAMPKTAELDLALRSLVRTEGQNRTHWIGLKNKWRFRLRERRWKWEDGSRLSNYKGWNPGQPDNRGFHHCKMGIIDKGVSAYLTVVHAVSLLRPGGKRQSGETKLNVTVHEGKVGRQSQGKYLVTIRHGKKKVLSNKKNSDALIWEHSTEFMSWSPTEELVLKLRKVKRCKDKTIGELCISVAAGLESVEGLPNKQWYGLETTQKGGRKKNKAFLQVSVSVDGPGMKTDTLNKVIPTENTDEPAVQEQPKTLAELQDDEAVVLEDGEAVVLEDDEAVVLEDGEAVVLEDDEAVVLEDDEAVVLEDDEAVVLEDDEAVVLEDGEAVVLEDDEAVVLEDGEAVVLEDGEAVVLEDGEAVVLEDGEAVVLEDGEAVVLEDGEAVVLEDGEAVVLEDGEAVVLEDGEAVVLEDGEAVVLEDGEAVVLEDGEAVVLEDGEAVVLEDGEAVVLEDGEVGALEVVDVLEVSEVNVLDDDELDVLKDGEVNVLEDGEVNVLEDDEVDVLEDDDINMLEDGEANVLEDGEVNVLEDGEANMLEDGEVNVLENGEVNVLNDGEVDALENGEVAMPEDSDDFMMEEGEVYVLDKDEMYVMKDGEVYLLKEGEVR
uniref:C-type lectin domain-containing protein n=1 Tax=Branchiostoma floridae TaxID=7739 RepID=C3YYQ6_BRAFL|eukprot:XP_002598402.1 hypothetical protein BRAFLDRAFT_83177 [Branchiostoma floridae]